MLSIEIELVKQKGRLILKIWANICNFTVF